MNNMMRDVLAPHFEGFDYPASQINKFIHTSGIFTMMLKGTNRVVSYVPENVEAFMDWLTGHQVADIRKVG